MIYQSHNYLYVKWIKRFRKYDRMVLGLVFKASGKGG